MLFSRKATFALFAFSLMVFASLLFPQEARADDIVLTSGYVSIGGAPLTRNAWRSVGFNFAGNNFTASGGAGDGQSRQGIQSPCSFSPCQPGATANPSSLVTFDGAGTATFNGTTSGAWWFAQDSHLTFSGLSVVIPESTASTLTLTSTFTMTGTVVVHALHDFPNHPILFSTTVSGSGIATLSFQYFATPGGGGYVLSNVRYDFTTIPEPTTLFLLGTGLAGLVARRRRRRAHK